MEGGKKEKSMFKIFKSTLQISVAVALVLQLGRVYFYGLGPSWPSISS